MKKHQSSTREALIDRFIANHNGGNVVEKYLAMSTKLTEEEMLFLRSLTTSHPFDQRMGTYRRTIDIIIDAKSTKKSISEVVPILRKYSENQYTLSRESVAMIVTNICVEALENYTVTYGLDPQRTHSLLLELHSHTDLNNLTAVLKELVTRNRFDTNSFKMKYFQMENIPLEILWYFHCINLVRFPEYIYNIADESAAVDHVKDCMVELLSSLYNGSNGDLKTTEDHMDVDEIPTTSNAGIAIFNQQADFLEQKMEEITENDDRLWKFRKEMIKDLLTSLICVAQSKSSNMEIMKSNARKCNNVLEDIFNKAMNNILTTLLNSSRMQSLNESYLSLLLQIPTLSKDVLQTFLISHFVVILSYKPIVDCHSAITRQGNWTYSKCSAGLTSFIESILTGLQDSCLEILKDMVQKEEINWKFVVICISTYLKCIPESGKNVKSLLNWLLNKAFLNQDVKFLTATFIIARQCCLEGCSPAFSSYITWFGTTFGPESPWANRNPATQQIFEFFIQFLTNIVPYEPPACLKVHINKAPTCPPNTHSLLMDYISLAKTRLKDLNEAPGFSLFGPELTTEQDIEHALRYFDTHSGEIAQTLLDASLFRRQHFEQEFLGKLLTTKSLTSHVVQDIENTKNKLITKLYNMGKIPHALFIKYQEECSAVTRAPDREFVDSPELFEVIPDPVERFHTCLTNLSDCVRGLSHYWETQRFEISETHLPPPVQDALKTTLLSVEELIGKKEKEIASVKATSVPSEQIISGSVGIDSHKCEQVVDDLLDTFFKCNVVKSHIFHQKFVEIFQTLSMKTMLLHKINICINDSINSTNKLKFIVALVHSIEYLGNCIFPYVRHAGEDISFATYLSQVFPLQNSHQMEICFRFAVEYMHYAEAHFLNLKHFLPDVVISTVPSVLIKKYLYLSKRYTFAEEYNLKELRKYRPNTCNPDLWNPLLMKSEMSFSEWFKQEASVIRFEDFLFSRHEYLINTITESSIFDSTNVINVATEVLHNVYSMDCSRDKYSMECGVITDEAWKNFHQDILQVLSMLLENFPLVVVGDVQPWLLQEWLKLQNIPKNNINFFRIVCILPPWLLYCNSRVDVPSENTVQAIGKFVMSDLKNVLCDEHGFLHAALIRYLLSGVSMTVAHNRVVGAFLFNLLFESCPALIIASRVQVSIVLPIIKKFNDICSEATSTLKHLLKRLPLIKLSSSDVMSKDMTMVSHWEVALDAWLENKPTCAFDSQIYKWIFFYNVLELGTQLQNGIISCKFDAESLFFCYSNMELISVNITTTLIAELEKDISIIETLDVILYEKHLPFCGLSELSQNLLSIAGLLLLIQYNTVKSNETNKFLSSSSNATMLCKVLLSNFTAWIKADSPVETYSLKREQKKKNLSPLVNADLLMNVRSLLYAVLTTVILKQNVTVPTVYFEGIGDVVIDNIFES